MKNRKNDRDHGSRQYSPFMESLESRRCLSAVALAAASAVHGASLEVTRGPAPTVQAQLPDLVVSSLSVGQGSAAAGGQVIVYFTVTNQGSGPVGSTTARIRLAAGTTITTRDPLLAEVTVGSLAPGRSQSMAQVVSIPGGTAPGSAYIGVTANAPSTGPVESNAYNNQRTTPFTVSAPVAQLPDLVISALSASATSGAPGDQVTVTFTATNVGNGPVGPTTARIRLAAGASITTSDPLLADVLVGSLAPGQSRTLTQLVTVPQGTSARAGYLGVTANAPSNGPTESNPSNNQRTMPFTVTAASVPAGNGDGLRATYWDSADLSGWSTTRVDPVVNFAWNGTSPSPYLNAAAFGARWTGRIQPRYSGQYTFYTTTDDGVRLWINGALVVNNWSAHPPSVNQGVISLVAGQQYDIRMDYYQRGGGAIAKLEWSSAQQSRQVVPQSQLSSGSGIDDWFSENLKDPQVAALARDLDADRQLTRNEMLSIFRQAENDSAAVSSGELADLRTLASSGGTLGMPNYVRALAGKVVGSNGANLHYQGNPLGNVAVGNPQDRVQKLVDKWFFGADHPIAQSSDGSVSYAYQKVDGSLFGSGVAYADVKQGSVGDCYLMASLAECAVRTPQTVRSMFVANTGPDGKPDGTYVVRFFNNGVADYVTVDSQLPVDGAGHLVFASRGAGANDPGNALWVPLAEKAYAQVNESGWLRRPNSLNGLNSYRAIDAGWAYAALSQISGVSAARDNNLRGWLPFTPDDFGQIVDAVQNSTRLICLNGTVTTSDQSGGHSFALVGFDATTQKFKLYNPWGEAVDLTWAQILDGASVKSDQFQYSVQFDSWDATVN